LSVNPDEYILIGGDFNQRRKKFSDLATKVGLKQILNEGTSTHVRGNHLDDIYTNLNFSAYTLVEGMSDHSGILVNLEVNLKRNQNLKKPEEYFT
jgi:hypothetical protein